MSKLKEQLNTFEATEVEETKAPSSLSMKLNVISGQRFVMVPQGSKIQSIISVAGHQVIRNLSEPSEFTLMHLDTYADYLRQVEPRTESRAVRALLTTGGSRTKKLHGRYLEVYGPYQVMLNVDGMSIYTRTYVTTDSDQIGQIYLGEDERRIGHDAMMEQDAVHIGYEADVTAHLLDTNGKKNGVTGLLDTGAVVSVMPIKTWERMGFTREDLIPTNLRLAAANRGAIYVAGRTPCMKLGSRVMPRRVGKTKVDSEISMKAFNSAKRKRVEEAMDLGQSDYHLSGTNRMLTDVAMVPPILMAGIRSTGYKSRILRDLIIQEGAAVACAKRRDALCFIRFMIEQISVPALNTCVKMLREGDERAKALLLLALLDMQQSKPMRVNFKEPEELEPMRKIDEIRRFSNKELRLTKESVSTVDRSRRSRTVTYPES